MVTQLRPPRAETPQRWQAALRRAADNALDLFEVAGLDGAFAVTSASDPSLCYLTTATSCGCPAALAQDEVCQHRAAVRSALGMLAPAPVADATPATVDCPACRGKGWSYAESMGGHGWPDQLPCRKCDGSGQVGVWLTTTVPAALAMAAD